MAKSQKYRNIDIEAATCVDLGHHWREIYFGTADGTNGALSGVPVRIALCEACQSQKLEHVGWDGRIISRYYKPDEHYIETARSLSDDFYSRRRALREAKTERFKREGNRGEQP